MASPSGQIRPLRYLALFTAIVAGLYALVLFTGSSPTPKLGIDLQGGSRVVLTARTPSGQEPNREQLQQAKQIINQRVNGLGVSGAEVVLDGANLVITVPGQSGDEARSLGRTAELRFRKVIQAVPAGQQPPQSGNPNQPNPSVQPDPSGQPNPSGQPTPPGTTEQGDDQQNQSLGVAGALPVTPQQAQQPSGDQPSKDQPDADTDGSGGAGSGDDPRTRKEIKQDIAQAKKLRQSANPQQQRKALAQLDCSQSDDDPLLGNDDADKPLVACGRDGNLKYLLGPEFLSGRQISDANGGYSQQQSQYVVTLDFKDEGSATWADFTSKNVGEQVAITLDSQVVSAPSINGPINGGQTQITGQFNQKDVTKLSNILKYGSLPLAFDQSQAQSVSATLGLASLKASLIAGGIGLALVVVYCLIYYRALGVLTVLSLALSGVVVYAVLVLIGRWLGFTLDLAGMAGFIIAIGITADSFIVFFERLKDEVREGRTFRSAVPRAWARARRTILSADAVSFLASAVLYVLAVGQVRGFAFTLGMSTVLDLIVVFLVTHPLVAMASRSKVLSRPAFSGLGAVQRMGADRRKADRARSAAKEA